MDGPQSAIVTGPAGEKIFCDEHGRGRVKFRWDCYNPATEASSCWVRVSQTWAGPGGVIGTISKLHLFVESTVEEVCFFLEEIREDVE